jgi:hypothetical protein
MWRTGRVKILKANSHTGERRLGHRAPGDRSSWCTGQDAI